MKKSYIIPLFAAALLATGCSKENPFDGPGSGTQGQFLKSAISVNVDAAGLETRATSAAEANVDDFTILFNSDEIAQPIKYRYGDMPEIVTLPAGSYTVTATYGENRDAEWESPHFLGESEKFTVSPMEITSYIDPIVCHLENIKVTIDFDPVLRQRMTPDSYVEVKVGSGSSLNYGIGEADTQKAGYFMHSEELTLVAVFHGTVDGNKIVETKSMRDIAKGTHYKVTFRLHSGADSDINGDADAQITVDATVEVTDVNRNIPLIEDEIMDDGERPVEGDAPGSGDQPSQPENPDVKAPTITADAPVNLEIVNMGADLDACVIHIHSEAGISAFTCEIDSEGLTEEELIGLSLAKNLDLVNTPDSMEESLKELGFPTRVGGQHDVELVLTPFIELLGALGPYQHNFILRVTDANGSVTKTLRIKYTE